MKIDERFDNIERKLDLLKTLLVEPAMDLQKACNEGWTNKNELLEQIDRLLASGCTYAEIYMGLCGLRNKPTSPPPPFKFEATSWVIYGGHCCQILNRQHVGNSNIYFLDDKCWHDEDVLSPCPFPPRFSVGDWVRHKDGRAGRVISVGVGACHVLFSTCGALELTVFCDLKPWVPREGEWVMHVYCGDISKPFKFDLSTPCHGYFIPAPLGSAAAGWFK